MSTLARIALCGGALCAAIGSVSAAPLVIITRPLSAAEETALRTRLGPGIRLGTLEWAPDPHRRVYVGDETIGIGRALLALDREMNPSPPRRPDILDGGVLMSRRPNLSVVYYTGRVFVQFPGATTSAAATTWGNGLFPRLELRGSIRRDSQAFVYNARFPVTQVVALQSTVNTSDPTIGFRLDTRTAMRDRRPVRGFTGGFHRPPTDRNQLAIVFAPGGSKTDATTIVVTNNSGTLEKTVDDDIMIATLSDETSLRTVRGQLQQPTVRDVARVGPVLSRVPLTVLTDQLVVVWNDWDSESNSSGILAQWGLEPVRDVSFHERGALYSYEEADYNLYDIAAELVGDGGAKFAVPNLLTFIGNTGTTCDGTLTQQASSSGTDCDTSTVTTAEATCNTHHRYLEQVDLCDWGWIDPYVQTRVGVLDRAVGGSAYESSLRIGTFLDVRRLTEGSSMEMCHTDPDDWHIAGAGGCGLAQQVSDWTHGVSVSMTAAAKHDRDMLGVAVGAPLISVWRDEFITEVALAETLQWMAGEEMTGWCRDKVNFTCTEGPGGIASGCNGLLCQEPALVPLSESQRASVINLSLWYEDFLLDTCSGPECYQVCENVAECGTLQTALARLRYPEAHNASGIRPGGVVVVAGAGDSYHLLDQCTDPAPHCDTPGEDPCCDAYDRMCWDSNNQPIGFDPNNVHPFSDLAASPSTIGVASVTDTGEPFTETGSGTSLERCAIGHWGPYMDVVAPMGADQTICKSCNAGNAVGFGESSAATAVVSGSAALMLDAAPDLTADQVECLLRATAQQVAISTDTAEWGPFVEFCRLQDLPDGSFSPCTGRGVVNVQAALDAAAACGAGTYNGCGCPYAEEPPPEIENLRRRDVSDSNGDASDTYSSWQPARGYFVTFHDRSKEVTPAKIAAEIEVDEPWDVPPAMIDMIKCLLDVKCWCERGGLCLALQVENPHDESFDDVRFEMCVSKNQCWDLAHDGGVWEPGAPMKVRLTPERDLMFHMQRTGRLPRLRAYSGDRQLLQPTDRGKKR